MHTISSMIYTLQSQSVLFEITCPRSLYTKIQETRVA